jgi:hypothetical protein
MLKSPDHGPKPSWREVIFVTLAIAAVVAFYFWFARSQQSAKPRPSLGTRAVSLSSGQLEVAHRKRDRDQTASIVPER